MNAMDCDVIGRQTQMESETKIQNRKCIRALNLHTFHFANLEYGTKRISTVSFFYYQTSL